MEKIERLDAYLERTGRGSVWFGRPNSFAWLTGGSNVVDGTAPVGVGAAGYDGSDLRVVTNNVEGQRLADEELDGDVRVETYPWHESSLADGLAASVDGPAAADFEVPGFDRVDPTPLRQPLTDEDLERYRELGSDTAVAVESVCRELQPGDTEWEVAAALSVALSGAGIESPVVLVGGGDRAQRYRHYTPQDAELGAYALVSVTARRDGLHASCTRTVAFEAPPWLEDRHATAARVETTALAATRRVGIRGGTSGDVFAEIREAYDALGFDGEWERHHQGGAAGYAGREWKGRPDGDDPVRLPMAFAWNPTVQGAKSEDTVAVTEDGIEALTTTGEWPTRSARAVGDELELERSAILEL